MAFIRNTRWITELISASLLTIGFFTALVGSGCEVQDESWSDLNAGGKADKVDDGYDGWLDPSDQEIPAPLARLAGAVASVDSAVWLQPNAEGYQWLASKLVIPIKGGETIEYDEEASVAEWVQNNYDATPCRDEKRLWQPTRGWGTAFLIHPRVVATARHNVEHMSCDATDPFDRLMLVFDAPEDRPPVDEFAEAYEPVHLPADKVYGCLDIIIDQDSDAALVLLDRPRNIDVFQMSTTSDQPATGSHVVHFGRPAGMTTQVSYGQVVPRPQPADDEHSFVGVGFRYTAMSAKGSSGGPVLIVGDNGYDVWGVYVAGSTTKREIFSVQASGCVGSAKPAGRYGTAVHVAVVVALLEDVTNKWGL